MDKFDPEIHDDNPTLDSGFMAGTKPSRRGRQKFETPKVEVKILLDAKPVAAHRKTLAEALAPATPQGSDWEPSRSSIASRVPDLED
jgi:hypothetical protein